MPRFLGTFWYPDGLPFHTEVPVSSVLDRRYEGHGYLMIQYNIIWMTTVLYYTEYYL
jgi:hypothetical protein